MAHGWWNGGWGWGGGDVTRCQWGWGAARASGHSKDERCSTYGNACQWSTHHLAYSRCLSHRLQFAERPGRCFGVDQLPLSFYGTRPECTRTMERRRGQLPPTPVQRPGKTFLGWGYTWGGGGVWPGGRRGPHHLSSNHAVRALQWQAKYSYRRLVSFKNGRASFTRMSMTSLCWSGGLAMMDAETGERQGVGLGVTLAGT